MNTFIIILTALQFGLPIRCYDNQAQWAVNKQEVGTDLTAFAYYSPRYDNEPAYIALGPRACKAVLRANLFGAYVLAHELAHHKQALKNIPFDEKQADAIAYSTMHRLLRRLQKHFKVKPLKQHIVRLAP